MVMKASKIIGHLRRKNVTAKDLSIAIGVTEAAVSKIIHGFRDPSLEVAKRMADYFGTTIDDLVS